MRRFSSEAVTIYTARITPKWCALRCVWGECWQACVMFTISFCEEEGYGRREMQLSWQRE